MRFPKDTRALIQKAAPNPITVDWPAGEREPQVGRVYWLQTILHDAKEVERKEKARREYSPETHAEVLAGMHRRRYGTEPPAKRKKPRRASMARPHAGDDRVLVIRTEIQDKGWRAKVVLYVDPDPVRHLGVKAKVPAGPNPIEGYQESTELEPEKVVLLSSRKRREEEEEALRIEHAGSVDMAKVIKIEEGLNDRRKQRKPAPLQEQAIARAKRRAENGQEA